MKITPYLPITALAALLASFSAMQADILISDFNNKGFDFYPGPPANWEAAATEGPNYLSIQNPDEGLGTAGFTTWITPIPNLEGSTAFHFDLRLGPGNEVEDFSFLITTLSGVATWNFTAGDLNELTFTTLVFDLATPDEISGSIDDLDQVTTINFSSPRPESQFWDLSIQFGNLVAVPEPSTGALVLGATLLGWAMSRRKA